jgi:hypothetical protein
MPSPVNFHPLFGRDVLEHSQIAAREGIDNSIPPDLLPNARRLSWFLGELNAGCLGLFKQGIYVSSGYRCPVLNVKAGGAVSPPSAHTEALAGDLTVAGVRPFVLATEIVRMCAVYNLDFDQIILEFGSWVHVSISKEGKKGRREIITAVKRPDPKRPGKMKTEYLVGLKDIT